MAYGHLEDDGVRARCDECGEWFDHLGNHVRVTHGMSCNEYRDAWGLSRKTGLIGPRLKEMRKKAAIERDDEIKKRFLERRPMPPSIRGFKHREESRRNREQIFLKRTERRRLLRHFLWQIRELIPRSDRISLARGWRWERICTVCGGQFIMRRWSRRKTCSRVCWLVEKRVRARLFKISQRPEVRRKISAAAKRRTITRDAKGRIVTVK